MLAGIQEKWRPLRAQLFPKVVMVDLSDQLVIGQTVKRGQPEAPIWTAPIPVRTCREGVPYQLDAVGDFLGDLLLEYGTIESQLVVSLPRQASHWRVIDLPANQQLGDSAEDLRELNPDLGWPFSLMDAYLDVQPLPARPSSSLVVAAERSVVDAWVEVFAIAGATLQHLLPAQVCQMWAMQAQLAATPTNTLVALLQPLGQQVNLTIWRQGVPEFERQLPGGTQELIAELQRCLNFYRSQDLNEQGSQSTTSLLVADPLPDLELLEQRLGIEAELIDRDGFGSLNLQGLATLELAQ